MSHDKIIYSTIKSIVRDYVPDAEVLLFGSRARNDAKSDSDFDLLITTKQRFTAEKKISIRSAIRKALLKKNIRSDILLQSQEEVEQKKKLPGHIIRNIYKDAIIL
ncbi:MAG: nucleotidyltransferase domain-containing protein [Bacteroidales bacterium]